MKCNYNLSYYLLLILKHDKSLHKKYESHYTLILGNFLMTYHWDQNVNTRYNETCGPSLNEIE